MSALARLFQLADHLETDMAYELRRLLIADGPARKVIEAEERSMRYEALAQECRLQLAQRDRQVTALTEAVAERDQALGAMASVHGGRLVLSSHVLDRGPWDVFLSVDPDSRARHVAARPRR